MPTMKFSQRIIRGIFFSIPLLGAVAFMLAPQSENLAPLYFASQPDYQVFLEDLTKVGQEKAAAEQIFSNRSEDHFWYQNATKTVSGVLADRTNISPYWTPQRIQDVSQYIVLMSHRYDLSPSFVLSLIEVESDFRPDAISPKGAVGLMQIKENTARSVGLMGMRSHIALSDPKTNIRLGLAYLQELKTQFRGNPNLVMLAYNLGPTATWKKIKSGEPIPTSYSDKIRKAMVRYGMPKRFGKKVGARVWL